MEQDGRTVTACILGDSAVAPFGLGGRMRLERLLARLGMRVVEAPEQAELVLSGACVFGASVLRALVSAPAGTLLIDDRGRVAGAKGSTGPQLAELVADGAAPPAGQGVTGAALAGRYDAALRKRADPMVMRLDDRQAAERALFEAAYKGVTDVVTRRLWPRPALAVTRACARAGIKPNQVTWASAVLMVLAFWLFWQGVFAAGLVVAWAMTFLDTVDGKLARGTLASSRFGDVLDHGIDLLHPPFWWWAWAVGCAAVGQPLADGGWTLGAIVVGYVLQRAEEGLFLARFGMDMHVWQPFDSRFREVTARRNPNLAILTVAAALGAPREGLIAVAVWVVVCLLVHAVRVAQAWRASRRAPLVSWLAAA